jgi:alanyl-tRNA synthetase
MPYDDARKLGAMAIFEEKYGDVVRVVKIGDYSLELCGGTHLQHTGEAGLFTLLNESSAAAGIRRLEAATGKIAEQRTRRERQLAENLRSLLNSSNEELFDKVRELMEQRKHLERELRGLRLQLSQKEIIELATRAELLNGFRVVAAAVHANEAEDLKAMGDYLRDRLGSGVGVLAAIADGKLNFVCVVTDDLIKTQNLKAGELIKRVAQIAGGSGGGRPHLATAGGKDASRMQEALTSVPVIVKEMSHH